MSFEVSVHIYTGAGGAAWKGPKFCSLTVRTPYYSMLPHTHTGIHRQTNTQAHAHRQANTHAHHIRHKHCFPRLWQEPCLSQLEAFTAHCGTAPILHGGVTEFAGITAQGLLVLLLPVNPVPISQV